MSLRILNAVMHVDETISAGMNKCKTELFAGIESHFFFSPHSGTSGIVANLG